MNVISRIAIFGLCVGTGAFAVSNMRDCPCAKSAKASSPACCSDVTRLSLLQGPANASTVSTSTAETAAEEAVELKPVKLRALEKAIASQPGKLVMVDFWATYCIPCKKGFPHLVQMHKDHAKDGLVTMSVTVDDIKDSDRALAFLKGQQATFANFLLDEETETWQEHWKFTSIPAVMLFKDGKKLRQFDYDSPEQFTYDDVEKTVVKLLHP